jgi:tetratricopeptide (TPR) repeat protein
VNGRLGKPEAAIDAYRVVLALTITQAGPEHPQVAVALSNIGGKLADAGDYEEARVYLERALVLYEKTYGPDAPEFADTLHNLGVAARMADEFEDAERFYRRALAILEKVNGPESPSAAHTLVALGVTLNEAGWLGDAHEALVRALAMMERTLDPKRAEIGTASLALTVLALDEKDHALAVRTAGRARDIYAAAFPGDWQEAYAWAYLGSALCRSGQRETGRTDMAKGVAMLEASHEPDKVDLVITETLLAECDALSGRGGDAARLEAALTMPGPPLRGRIQARAELAVARELWLEERDRPLAIKRATDARDRLRRSPRGVEPLIAEADAWLAGHER